MLQVPSHLLQPLHVDTNIVYDMDIDLFPGLDDPAQMYEPALFIATDWSQFIHDPKDPVIRAEPDLDLFELIESTQPLIPNLDSSSELDPDTFQTMLDDVIADNVSPDDILDIPDSDWSDVTTCSDISDDSLTSRLTEDSNMDAPETNTEIKYSKKRGRSDEDCSRDNKRSKLATLDILYPVSLCSRSSRSVMARGS